MTQDLFTLIDIERRALEQPAFYLPPRAMREQLRKGMLAKLIFATCDQENPNLVRNERLWVRVLKVTTGESIDYVGELASDSYSIDIEQGHVVLFGPQHVCEWDVKL